MLLSVGIVGFPNAGKSTLFNALIKRQIASTASYPFCTIEPNKGVVPVPDERLALLAKIVKTEHTIPAVVEFIDIAGLVKGAHKGEGLGNQFLGNIKEVNLILFLLRAFDIPGVDKAGSINPVEDLKNLKLELILKDLDTLSKGKEPRGLVLKAKKLLEEEKYLNEYLSDKEKELLKDKQLLSCKDYLLCLNVTEDKLKEKNKIKEEYSDLNLFLVSAKTEEDLAVMDDKEGKEYLSFLGLEKSGLELLIQLAYQKLNLISFLTTTGEKEVRAWTIKKGTPAVEAAGVIHTDFSDNFIKVKVVGFNDFIFCGGWKLCAEQGKLRLEGRDYLIKEGEIVEFMIGK